MASWHDLQRSAICFSTILVTDQFHSCALPLEWVCSANTLTMCHTFQLLHSPLPAVSATPGCCTGDRRSLWCGAFPLLRSSNLHRFQFSMFRSLLVMLKPNGSNCYLRTGPRRPIRQTISMPQ